MLYMNGKVIKLNENNNYSIALINGNVFLSGNNLNGSKYFLVPKFITILKKNDELILNLNKNADFFSEKEKSSFFERLNIFLKNVFNNSKKLLYLKGLGYRLNLVNNNQEVSFKIGYSHLKYLGIPKSMKVKIGGKKKNVLQVEGPDKSDLGNFVKQILDLRASNNYKEKGFILKYQKKILKPIKKK